jgi:nucleoside-diphosphate-sugar epimerase
MKVLVTGANGLVGRSLCVGLIDRRIAVRAAVRSATSVLPEIECVLVGAVNGATNWRAALVDVQIVVHLAARVHVLHDHSAEPLAEFRQVNVQGTLELARQAASAGVRRFVFISSVKVNGESTCPGQAFLESDPPNPQDAYGISKHEAEQGLRQLALETDLDVVIIRPPLVYGPGVKANFAALMQAVQNGWPLPLGAVNNRRSLVALDNLTDFIMTVITHPAAANQTFLISDGQDLSTAELIRAIADAVHTRAHLISVPLWLLEWVGRLTGKTHAVGRLCGNLQVDSSKARNLLGWVPVVSVQEGLRRVIMGKQSS